MEGIQVHQIQPQGRISIEKGILESNVPNLNWSSRRDIMEEEHPNL